MKCLCCREHEACSDGLCEHCGPLGQDDADLETEDETND